MKTASVIIGANYGDEGKGLFTDYLASQHDSDCLVVRFNGGAQCGHTVVEPDIGVGRWVNCCGSGRRHVFSHFGSGTFAGADTFLSKYFVANPILFYKEHQELLENKVTIPNIYIDQDCFVTTPYDMLINQMLENQRSEKHGSCGIGFNETITRCLYSYGDFSLTVKDLLHSGIFIKRLKRIKEVYFHKRLQELGIKFLHEDLIFERFVDDIIYFRKKILLAKNNIINDFKHIIFEGGQGLLLDEKHKNFPHVTRSRTGLHNVRKIIKDTNFEIFYITRAYLTRHGVGPFEDENKSVIEKYNIKDPTNIYNEFQGTLRFGFFNIDLLLNSIGKEKANLVITCLDQIPLEIYATIDNELKEMPISKFINILKPKFNKIFTSYGPTRLDVYQYNKKKEQKNERTS